MMTEICQYLHNWFDRGNEKLYGTFSISDGEIEGLELQTGQWYRIVGSALNDGVWKYGEGRLRDERPFNGSVWPMSVPPAVEQIATEISAWMEKYGAATAPNMSPYASESFGGYSYSKGGSGGGTSGSWADAYGARLKRWRKMR